MRALLQAFLQIALRRQGPEDLPDSAFLLTLAAVAYAALQVLAALPVFGGLTGPLVRNVAVDLALLAGCLWLLLAALGFRARYRQTLTAWLGTGALLTLAMLPAYFWVRAGGGPERVALLPTLVVLAVLVWSVTVNGHILARALSTGFPLGVALALCYLLLNFVVVWQLGPAA